MATTPTLEGLSREEKLALLRRLSAERAAAGRPVEGAAAPAPAAADVPQPGADGSWPASFGQRRLWFLERLDPATAHNNVFRAMRLVGPIDPRALARALGRVVARHGALRTRFEEADGEPRQVVEPAVAPPLARIDLAALAPDEREQALGRAARAAAAAPFDLSRAPLARVVLARLAPEDHALLVALHHIVADGWSLGLFYRELSAAYAAALAGEPWRPVPAAQFAPWAADQRRRLSGAGLERELAAWRRLLDGVPTVLDLPTDRPRPSLESYRGDTVPFALEPPVAAALRELGRASRASLFMVLAAGFAALLARWSGQASFILGTPVAGRPEPELESAIGFFANTLALPVDLGGAPTFAEVVERTRRTALAALGHQEVPFERVVEELAPSRDLSRNPLYQVMVALQNAPGGRLALGAAEITPFGVRRGLSKVDLTLDVAETAAGGVAGYLEYSTDLFERATVEAMAGQLGVLLAAAAAAPETPADRLPLADAPGAVPSPREPAPPDAAVPVHLRFFERAAARPDAPAVVADGVTWSYGELARRTIRLAARLRRLGVGPEVRVAVVAERSPEAIAAFLAVLAAGGAYVPLDPEYPEERLAFVAEDAGAALALATPALAGRLAALAAGRPTRVLDAAAFASAPEVPDAGEAPGAPVHAVPHPDAAAYVLYTSGTTGRPKGVVVPHRALANHAAAVARAYELAPGQRALQFASLAFDIAGEEIYPSLACGVTLVLRTADFPLEPAAFADAVARHRLELVNIPTPLWHEWALAMEEGRALPPASLERVVVGTEGARPDRLAAWGRALVDAGRAERPRWVNAYGPTETTITVTFDAVAPRAAVEPPARVPIGRALAGTDARVVDPLLDELPPGVPGELVVGGAGVARGYHGRPAATAAVFVPDPGGPAGGRLYRTGDLVRRRTDGRLEFFGRTDDQVKIRGFRIEPAEVEAALVSLPAVAEAAVLALAAASGDRRLVGFVAPRAAGDPAVAPEALARALGRRLPPYMVPERFVSVERLPLTPAGKVDRAALARLAGTADAATGAGAATTPPRGPLEELVADVWAEVLGVEAVGAHDDFFRLGGHSLLATRVLGRLRDRLGVELPLRALFEAPTVAELAERASAARGTGATLVPASPISPIERPAPAADGTVRLPASFGQSRLWFLDRLEPASAAYNVPAAVRLDTGGRPLDPRALGRALATIVERHETLRTTFAEGADGAPEQVVHPPAPPLVRHDLSALPPAAARRAAERIAAAEARRPFDLGHGPLVRLRLLSLPAASPGGAEHRLLATFHHAVSDGWSIDLFLGELAALYATFATGGAAPTGSSLPPLPVQYGDYAAWQRERLAGDSLDRLLAFWRGALDGAPELLDLPADRPRPPLPSLRGARVYFRLPPTLTAALGALGRRAGTSLFMTTLAAWQVVLARATGSLRPVVGTPVAGRGRPEIERLIGLFVNTLVLAGDLDGPDGGPSVLELLSRVREATLEAFAHDELPFERLVEELRPERSLGHNPLFQVMFALQSSGAVRQGSPAGSAAGEAPLPLVPVLEANFNDTARVDLNLNLWQQGDGMVGFVEYATDLFDRTTAERIAGWYRSVLAAAVERPERPALDLPLFAPAARHQLLGEWNGPAAVAGTEPEPATTLHDLVIARAARHPERTAIVCGETEVTYGELVRHAAALAAELGALGVGPGARVGLFLGRSPAMVAAMLGVLEAGAAYVPLDPGFPAERLDFVVRDAGLAAIVVDRRAAAAPPPAAAGLPRLAVPAVAEVADRPSPPHVDPETLAYVIYTSGSTGRPKGVAVPHAAAVAFLRAMARAPGLDDTDTLLAVTTLSFDIALLELFLPLVVGGRVAVATAQEAADGGRLAALAGAVGATALQATPATWRLLAEVGWRPPVARAGRGRRFRALAGGEALPRDLADRLLATGAELWNLYGPTETTVWSAASRVAAGPIAPTVGGPIAGTSLAVADRALRPTPIGVAGELLVGGAGVARGYLGRPGLTAERFVPDPFAPLDGGRPGARLYRTGDRVRRLADGRLEFLGRLDHQVKVRGFRIELGEVEAALAALPAIEQAAVVAAEDRLVAYLVVAGEAPEAEALRAALGRRLPGYMVPALFVVLDELPLTANGKVDRRALPAPEALGDGRVGVETPYRPPATEVEERLVEIWQQVLRRDRIGVDDRFFDLGGHSLLAAQVVNRIAGELEVEVPLRTLFERPTVAGLAAAIVDAELEGLAEEDLARLLDDVEDLTDDELAALTAATAVDVDRGDER